MKFKLTASLTGVLLLLACLGLAACGAERAPVVSETATPEPEPAQPPVPPAPSGDEEAGYRADIASITVEINSVVNRLDGLLGRLELDSDEWVSEVSTVGAEMTGWWEAAGQIAPPESMAEFHVAYLETVMHFNDATALLLRGLEETDYDSITQASSEIWLTSEVLADLAEAATLSAAD